MVEEGSHLLSEVEVGDEEVLLCLTVTTLTAAIGISIVDMPQDPAEEIDQPFCMSSNRRHLEEDLAEVALMR